MRTLYLDCFSGISGDMTVGALRDLGVPEEVFHQAIASLGLEDEFHIHFRRGHKQNIAGWKFDVHAAHEHGHSHEKHGHAHSHDDGGEHHHEHTHGDGHSHSHPHEHGGHAHSHEHSHPHEHEHHHEGCDHVHGRSYREIRALLEASTLAETPKARALAVFHRIALAEGKIHGIDPEEITFHEVGAIDSIADIVAACAGIDALGIECVLASRLVEGSGWITCAHGRFPLPAPATLEILAGIPLKQVDEATEYITPTGAALLAEYCSSYGPMPEMRIEKVGYGLGTRDTYPRPNVLRATLGETTSNSSAETDEIVKIETNIDDLTPELAGATMERLFAAGALDVFYTAAQMKKNRPGFLLTVLVQPEKVDEIATIILRETSAFGIRLDRMQRMKLRREFRDVETPYGIVRIKVGFLGDEIVQAAPEYESCREVAQRAGVSVRDVHLAAWIGSVPSPTAGS